MALHTDTTIHKTAYDLFDGPWHRTSRKRTVNEAMSRVRSIDAGELFETANSYFGLFREATHSHHDRTRLANVLRYRGHCISGDLTKIYRRTI